jgi:hypothetical protein
VLWCSVLQCSDLVSREFVSDVKACGCGSLVVCARELFHVSGRYWVGGIRWDVGKFMCVLRVKGMGVLKESVGGSCTPVDGHIGAQNMLRQYCI